MLGRLIAIALIFGAASVGWMILGGTISYRTEASRAALHGRVASLWGSEQAQPAPWAVIPGKPGDQTKSVPAVPDRILRPSASEIAVNLNLEQRKKGLLWFSTYRVRFEGTYRFVNPDPTPAMVQLRWAFPAKQAVYDDLQFVVNGTPVEPQMGEESAVVNTNVAPGEAVSLAVTYRSQGMDSWSYRFGDQVSSVPDFAMRTATDFKNVDFADNTLSPTAKRETDAGWQLDWAYTNLYSGAPIQIVMPQRQQPGPLAAEISFFAPVSLGFFFFLMLTITTLREIDLHPVNYFFLACAFFAFHLLLAYSVDHIDIYPAFALSAAVSVGLVVTYLRIVVGPGFALREAALTQIVYLVLFSFAFFFEGFTGLAVTIGSILTLFVVMQMTGRIRWSERFAGTAPGRLA